MLLLLFSVFLEGQEEINKLTSISCQNTICYVSYEELNLPDIEPLGSVDLLEYGLVTETKDMGSCDCPWAFIVI